MLGLPSFSLSLSVPLFGLLSLAKGLNILCTGCVERIFPPFSRKSKIIEHFFVGYTTSILDTPRAKISEKWKNKTCSFFKRIDFERVSLKIALVLDKFSNSRFNWELEKHVANKFFICFPYQDGMNLLLIILFCRWNSINKFRFCSFSFRSFYQRNERKEIYLSLKK